MDVDKLVMIVSASAILLFSGGLLAWHYVSWRRTKALELPPEEKQFLWRQCRRRSQCSAMLGILAVMLLAWCWVTEPLGRLVLGIGALLLLAWVVLLAVAEWMVTRYHYGRQEHRCLLEQTKLEIQARRLVAAEGNGRGEGRHEPPDTDDERN